MRKANKILLSIISLLGVLISVGVFSIFYPVPFLTGFLQENLLLANYIFAGYNALMCFSFLIFLLVIFLLPNRLDFLAIDKEKGKIEISRRTIESTARHSFEDIDSIGSVSIKAKLHIQSEKIRIFVKISFKDTSHLADLTQTIQNRIEKALLESLGMSIKSIFIKVVEYKPNDKAKKLNERDSRVI